MVTVGRSGTAITNASGKRCGAADGTENDGDGNSVKSKQEAEENEEQKPIYTAHPYRGKSHPSFCFGYCDRTAGRNNHRNNNGNDDSSQLTMCDWDFPWCFPKPPWEASLAGALRREGIAFAAIVEGAICREEERWSIGRVSGLSESQLATAQRRRELSQ